MNNPQTFSVTQHPEIVHIISEMTLQNRSDKVAEKMAQFITVIETL